jgi:hypothetical protein
MEIQNEQTDPNGNGSSKGRRLLSIVIWRHYLRGSPKDVTVGISIRRGIITKESVWKREKRVIESSQANVYSDLLLQ